MKRSMVAALAALALVAVPAAGAGTAFAAELKVAVVDLQKALNETQGGKAAKEALQAKYQPKADLINAREKELKDIQEKLKSSVLSKDAKTALQKDFEKKLGEYQDLAGRTKFEMDRENKAATAKILDGLYEICQKIARDEGYTLVLEKTGSGLIYFAEPLDLTERVLKAYNERKPAAGK